MKRNQLAALTGAILASGMTAAAADVTVFGHIDTSYTYTDQDGVYVPIDGDGIKIENQVGGTDDSHLECTTCSLGFKGSEYLGNGLKAIFKLDFQYDTINRDTSSFTDRDQWLGLAGSFGSVKVGTISTSYKSHGAMIDPFYRTSQQARDRGLQSVLHSGAGEDGQGRADNTIRYDSPSWNGLQATLHYTLDSDKTSGPGVPPDDKEDDDPYGGGVSYNNGGFLVYADYITNDLGGDDSAYKVGGKYDLNLSPLKFSFLAQYEVDDGLISYLGDNQRVLGSGDGADTWLVGASAGFGNTMAYFSYGKGSDGGSGSIASSYDVWQLMAAHSLSKRTSLYLGFSEIDCDDKDNNVCSLVGNSGGEDDKFSAGMKHKF
jgi:predicted porin